MGQSDTSSPPPPAAIYRRLFPSPCAAHLPPFSNMEERERESAKSDVKETAASGVSTTPPPPEREAAPAAAAQREAGDGDADKTDVCSGNFEPLVALYAPAAPLPFPNIRGFNNVAAYESFMKGGRGRAKPENVEKRRRKAMKGVADPERIARLKKLIVNNPVSETGESSGGGGGRRRRQKPQKNVLTRMPRRFFYPR